jgi:hypothetical protein
MMLFHGTGWLIIFPANAFFDLLLGILSDRLNPIAFIDLGVMGIWIFIMSRFARIRFRKFHILS